MRNTDISIHRVQSIQNALGAGEATPRDIAKTYVMYQNHNTNASATLYIAADAVAACPPL